MTTWATISSDLGRLLSDPQASTYPEALRMLAFNRALEHFALTHTARVCYASGTASAWSGGAVYTLPDDFIQERGVQASGAWLEPTLQVPGETDHPGGYTIHPSGTTSQIFFADDDVADFSIWYYGFFPSVTGTSDVIAIPRWAELALLHLSIALILTPMAIQQADLRRWATRRDSGDPEDNPPRRQAMWHLEQYRSLLGDAGIPAQQRQTLFTPGIR